MTAAVVNSTTVVTPELLSLVTKPGTASGAFVGSLLSYASDSAGAPPAVFFIWELKTSISKPVEGYTTPKERFCDCSCSSPAHVAFFPASALPAKLATRYGPEFGSLARIQRYGACSSAASLSPPPKTTIFLAATIVVNASPLVTSITMNGFFAITSTASARCAASSEPDAVKYSNCGVRPHSW